MSEIEELTATEKLLLMAAAECALGPGTNISRANTIKVIRKAASYAGLSDDDLRQGMEGPEWHPAVERIYDALVRMVHQMGRDGAGRPPERPGAALFEGGGNWGIPGDPACPPSWPQYNSCRLTERGAKIALELLAHRRGMR